MKETTDTRCYPLKIPTAPSHSWRPVCSTQRLIWRCIVVFTMVRRTKMVPPLNQRSSARGTSKRWVLSENVPPQVVKRGLMNKVHTEYQVTSSQAINRLSECSAP